MTTTSLESQLVVGAILFALGMIGFLTRRNLILIVLSTELMLHGVSVNLTAFGRYHGNPQGQVFTIFVLTIAACEAGLALALILTLYQRRKSLDVFLWANLGEEDLPILSGESAVPPAKVIDPNVGLPHLTPAGPGSEGAGDENLTVPPPAFARGVLTNRQISLFDQPTEERD